MQIGSFELHRDLAPADWVVDCIHDFAVDVGAVIPAGFPAYARLLHPASRFEDGGCVPVRWAEIAAANGRTVHPEMQWPHISGVFEHSGVNAPGLWDHEPDVGTLPPTYAAILGELLAGHTQTPHRVWFCVWEGWGGLQLHPTGSAVLQRGRRRRAHREPRLSPPAPRVHLPSRGYYLLSGPIGAITESFTDPPGWQSANLWWPDDRAWCIATEVDFAWTYVGGSAALAAALIDHPDLEGIAARIDDAVTYEADRINPPPPRRTR